MAGSLSLGLGPIRVQRRLPHGARRCIVGIRNPQASQGPRQAQVAAHDVRRTEAPHLTRRGDFEAGSGMGKRGGLREETIRRWRVAAYGRSVGRSIGRKDGGNWIENRGSRGGWIGNGEIKTNEMAVG